MPAAGGRRMTDRVAVLTDSSAGMPADQARRFDVHVVPIHLTIGSDEFRDGLDLDPAVLYQALQKGVPVKSAAPSPLDYADAVEATLSDDVVVVTPASEFTFMYRNASLAAELSDRRVTVVDSRSATAGHGLVVLAGAQAAAGGGTVDDVVSAAEDAASRVELVGALETLDYLRSSGRVPAIALGLATQLGVRPVFRFEEGVAERVGLPRSEEAALARIVREWRAAG